MFSVKANTARLLFRLLLVAIFCGLFHPSVARGQDPPMMSYPPWADDDLAWTNYKNSVAIDVLINDVPGSNPIDPSTVTIVSGPTNGTASIDPVLGIVVYTPAQNFSGFDAFQYTVADTMGNVSNTATVDIWVDNMPPTITVDYYEDADDMWVFFGTVTDESPGALIVVFGELLQGKTAIVDQNGNYTLYVLLAPGTEGLISVQTTDELGVASDVVEDYVYQY